MIQSITSQIHLWHLVVYGLVMYYMGIASGVFIVAMNSGYQDDKAVTKRTAAEIEKGEINL